MKMGTLKSACNKNSAEVGYCSQKWHPGMNLRWEAFVSGEQTFVPKLVNMFKISKLLVFEILDDFGTEVVIY